MISKIISRAASLRELASNPKSFSNCPDLHGGVPDLPGGSPRGTAYTARSGFGRIHARQQPDSKSFGEPNIAL
jgi:plasmid stabilization system protein ParE